jgi:hypothetical protein
MDAVRNPFDYFKAVNIVNVGNEVAAVVEDV